MRVFLNKENCEKLRPYISDLHRLVTISREQILDYVDEHPELQKKEPATTLDLVIDRAAHLSSEFGGPITWNMLQGETDETEEEDDPEVKPIRKSRAITKLRGKVVAEEEEFSDHTQHEIAKAKTQILKKLRIEKLEKELRQLHGEAD
jgi:hypothetical protein